LREGAVTKAQDRRQNDGGGKGFPHCRPVWVCLIGFHRLCSFKCDFLFLAKLFAIARPAQVRVACRYYLPGLLKRVY
jgi:hypothetical protein